MAERLLVISDMWGVKKGLWITSYLGYLQQYFDIVFYDVQQLANIDLTVNTDENIHDAFVNGGIDTAVAHLLKKETEASHCLAFSTGGTIAWKANLKGLKMKSLYTISSTRLRLEEKMPNCPVTLLYGEKDTFKPKDDWFKNIGVEKQIVPEFGHKLYTDEKIIGKVCQDLLGTILKKQFQY
ncbi:MAG: hypothetical protein V3U92_10640 [Cellulophaga sp.]